MVCKSPRFAGHPPPEGSPFLEHIAGNAPSIKMGNTAAINSALVIFFKSTDELAVGCSAIRGVSSKGLEASCETEVTAVVDTDIYLPSKYKC